MSSTPRGSKQSLRQTFLVGLLCASALTAVGAHAQEAAPTPSQNATVNLIRALVQKGVLEQAEADAMIAQAEAEAAQARATAESTRQAAQTAVAASSPASAQPGTSVRYIPQFVRDEIKNELRTEVLAEARTQGLVAPDALPDWVRGIRLSGDLRLRGEGRFFADGNALNFVNIGAINNGEPYNTDPNTNPNNPPILNSSEDRTYFRLRARFGIEARIDEDLTAHLRIATGSDSSPVSTNQTLGGFFSKKDLWLDQAYLDYRPTDDTQVLAGRMPNPFRTPELVWDDDINLDGVAVSYAPTLDEAFSVFGLVGAFPLDYVPDDFPTTGFSSIKTDSSEDKWLFAGQLGTQWRPDDRLRLGLNAAYYLYSNVEGDLSPSCVNTAQFCLTDFTRPGFSQKGNTLFALRDNFTLDPNNQAAPQYYGLASEFEVLAVSGDLRWALNHDVALNLAGHYSRNLAYDEVDILTRGFNPNTNLSQIVNNNERCAVPLAGNVCPAGQSIFDSGDSAWLVRASLGTTDLIETGDWSLTAAYRHVEPDALLDAFTDSDFRLGGTNVEGWSVGGAYGLRRNTNISLRWINGEEISGPPFRVDVLHADINAKF